MFYGVNNMISIEEYKQNPCEALSIPYWKATDIIIPDNVKIIHNKNFDETLLEKYSDKQYFRLIHRLNYVLDFSNNNFTYKILLKKNINELVEMINASYLHTDVFVSADYINGLTETKVYFPELWIGAFDNTKLVGSIICDLDTKMGEGIIEWLQVLPEYRGKGIASVLVCKALNLLKLNADFVTVSGECDNITNPESVYRKCGFVGNDIWHILAKR